MNYLHPDKLSFAIFSLVIIRVAIKKLLRLVWQIITKMPLVNSLSHPNRLLYAIQLLGSNKLFKKTWGIKRNDSRYKDFLSVFSGVTNLENLICFIHGVGFVSLKMTPHYAYAQSLITGNRNDEYPTYMKQFYPLENQEKILSDFKKTFLYVSANSNTVTILVSKRKFFDNNIMIIDGVHRAAILAALNHNGIRCYICI